MSMGGGGQAQQQLQQISQAIEEVEGEVEAVREEVESLRAEQHEVNEAADALGDLETGSTVQVPLGGGAYLRATVDDIDAVIVSLGGDYAAEQDEAGAVDALERKHDQIDDQIDDLQAEIDDLEDEQAELESQAQQLQQQLQQQQMQQMQQGDE